MVHTIAVHIPNLLPKSVFGFNLDWACPAGRLIWSSALLVLGIAIVFAICKRPKPKEQSTWGQAMLGAVATWALLILAYGTVPHEWLNFANSYLQWNASAFLVTSGQKIGPVNFLNFDINKAAITDVIATGIYVVLATINIRLFVLWQKRPTQEAAAAAKSKAAPADEEVVGTSAYGRPMTAKV